MCQISVPGYGVITVKCTISGTAIANSRTTRKRSSSQAGSTIRLMATLMPIRRAVSSAFRFSSGLTRLRYRSSPSASIASMPRNMYRSPSRAQRSNTSGWRSSTSERVSR